MLMQFVAGQITPDIESVTPSTSGVESIPSAVIHKGGCWAEEFPIPWSKISSKLRKALTLKKRVIPS